jgi:P-type Cu+ transporter
LKIKKVTIMNEVKTETTATTLITKLPKSTMSQGEKKLTFDVDGMTCASCSSAVEKAAKKVPGIDMASVNLMTNQLTITYSEEPPAETEVIKAIEKAGYDAKLHRDEKSVIIPVEGMTCASCTAAVERTVKKLPGVLEVSVNLATNKAAVKYDGNLLRLSEIKKAIEKAGYTPKEIEKQSAEAILDDQKQALRRQWWRFIIAISFAVPLFYLAMGHMLNWPMPEWLHPMDYPLRFALTQLLLIDSNRRGRIQVLHGWFQNTLVRAPQHGFPDCRGYNGSNCLQRFSYLADRERGLF